MDRLKRLEKDRLWLVARVADLASEMPDGRAANAAILSALYTTLVKLLSEELRLSLELSLGIGLVDRIKGERELALANGEFWRGSAIAWLDDEAGLAVPAS